MENYFTFYLSTKKYNQVIDLASLYNVSPESIIIRAIELGEKAFLLQEQGIRWQEYVAVVMKIQEKIVRIQSLLSQHEELQTIIPQLQESLKQAKADSSEAEVLLSQLKEILMSSS